MKEKLIELFTKVGNETDTFAPFVTCDQFENLADEIVKLCNLHFVSKSFVSGSRVEITGCFIGHEFEIGEIVTLIEENGEQWLAENSKGERWYIIPEETNAC